MSLAHRYKLDNGLTVVIQEDFSTPLAVVNVLYDVGSRDESPEQTGFAHLFEHFMFEGSVNIEEFDTPLEFAGGESNAFTTPDLTNYYEILPAQNIDTALWLESDRMIALAFDTESLETQKRVVSEEFKEHYINKPYGNVWHELCALAYHTHPYRWPTIGLELAHIEEAKMEDVRSFFDQNYHPKNAIISICGAIKKEEALAKVKYWFGEIDAPDKNMRKLPPELPQTSARYKTLVADVPANAIYKAYKMPPRNSVDYFALDLLRDAIAGSETATLYLELVKEKRWLSNVNCYLTESLDEGLFVLEGKLLPDVSFEEVDEAVQLLTEKAIENLDEKQLQKLKNKFETYWRFSDTNLMNRAFNLAFYELLGDANDFFDEINQYNLLDLETMKKIATAALKKEKCSTIFYAMEQKKAEI